MQKKRKTLEKGKGRGEGLCKSFHKFVWDKKKKE